MSDKINVLISEEDVEKRIQERIRRKMCTSDLRIKGRRIFRMRTGKKNYRTGNHGLYVRIQLRR